jgi:hypothetical protein
MEHQRFSTVSTHDPHHEVFVSTYVRCVTGAFLVYWKRDGYWPTAVRS